MRILALVTDAYGGSGGIAQYNRDLFTALQALPEVKAVVVLPRTGQGMTGLSRVRQSEPVGGRLGYIIRALGETHSLRPDVVFCGHLFMLPLAVFLGAVFGKPVWLQIHGIDAWQRPSQLSAWLSSRVALVSSVSRYTRAQFLRWACVPPDRVNVLPNTVSPAYRPADRQAARREFGIEGKVVLLTVGRMSASEAYKGQDRVLRCLGALSARHPTLLYLIAGSGDDQPRLEALAAELGMANRVRFLGRVGLERLPALYNAADLFVMPSTGEGFGIVYLESMACGTPALGLDSDGSRDPLRDGQLGHVATAETLGDAIHTALNTPRPAHLAEETRRLFGTAAFEAGVAGMLRAWLAWPAGKRA